MYWWNVEINMLTSKQVHVDETTLQSPLNFPPQNSVQTMFFLEDPGQKKLGPRSNPGVL